MYLGVDVGGTKTLVAVLNNDGEIREQARFPTPKKYENWLLELRHVLSQFKTQEFRAGGVAMPGRIDRHHGRVSRLGNLKQWGQNIPVLHDVERLAKCPMVLENDAKLAGLSEAMLLRKKFSRVLYMTVSTGIGIALIEDCEIDVNIGDGGGKAIMVERGGKHVSWESFASGRAIYERYGKQAKDIHDEKVWKQICRDLSVGMIELIAITEPEVIVIGGGVGSYFDRYDKLLQNQLEKYRLPMIDLPKLRGAQRPEQAVVFGCYDLAKRTYGKTYAAATS